MATDYSFIGVGKVYLREYGVAEAMREVGNVTALNFAVTEDIKELKDYTQTGGGTYNEVRRVDSVESSMSISDFSPENLALAVFGSSSSELSGTETDETITAYKGGFNKLSKVLDTISTVNSAASAGGTEYVLGTDYEIRNGGLFFLSGASITDGDTVYVTYTTSTANIVQALVNSAKEYEIVFDGLNDARSGKAVTVKVHRQKMGATSGLDLIGDDFGSLELSGKVLKDTTITTTGLSQYFTVQVEV